MLEHCNKLVACYTSSSAKSGFSSSLYLVTNYQKLAAVFLVRGRIKFCAAHCVYCKTTTHKFNWSNLII